MGGVGAVSGGKRTGDGNKRSGRRGWSAARRGIGGVEIGCEVIGGERGTEEGSVRKLGEGGRDDQGSRRGGGRRRRVKGDRGAVGEGSDREDYATGRGVSGGKRREGTWSGE